MRDNRGRQFLAFEVDGERHVSCREQQPLPPGPGGPEVDREGIPPGLESFRILLPLRQAQKKGADAGCGLDWCGKVGRNRMEGSVRARLPDRQGAWNGMEGIGIETGLATPPRPHYRAYRVRTTRRPDGFTQSPGWREAGAGLEKKELYFALTRVVAFLDRQNRR